MITYSGEDTALAMQSAALDTGTTAFLMHSDNWEALGFSKTRTTIDVEGYLL